MTHRGRPRSPRCKRGHSMEGHNVCVSTRTTKCGKVIHERGCWECRSLRKRFGVEELDRAWEADPKDVA